MRYRDDTGDDDERPYVKVETNGNGRKFADGIISALIVSGLIGNLAFLINIVERLSALETKVDIAIKEPWRLRGAP